MTNMRYKDVCLWLCVCARLVPGCAGTVWPFQGCLCFQTSTGLTWFSKYSKWASLDNVRNISAILRACGRRWRWSVLPSLFGVWSVECGVWSAQHLLARHLTTDRRRKCSRIRSSAEIPTSGWFPFSIAENVLWYKEQLSYECNHCPFL